MGLLDALLQGALSGGLGQAMGGGQQRPAGQGGGGDLAHVAMAVLPVVLGMMANRQGGASASGAGGGGMGGLGDLLAQFQRAGFGEQARSWVGTGQNMPVSSDAMAQVFGGEGLAKIAAQAGLTEQQASAGLSEVFPDVVDRLTPHGQVPESDALAASLSDLQRRFGL